VNLAGIINKMDKKIRQLRFRQINRKIFEAVRDGIKKVETRAASPKFCDIKEGDIIVLKCGREKIEKKVKKAEIFKEIKNVFKKYRPQDILPGAKSPIELEKMWYSFPEYERKIKQYGLIALEFYKG
jgi:ASC-1-like (ASCH) protein